MQTENYLLSEKFGWTPEQIGKISSKKRQQYLAMINYAQQIRAEQERKNERISRIKNRRKY